MLRQGLRGSYRSSNALWKSLAEELSCGNALARDSLSVTVHGTTIVQYHSMTLQRMQMVRVCRLSCVVIGQQDE